MINQKYLSRYVSYAEAVEWIKQGQLAYLHKGDKIYRFAQNTISFEDYPELTFNDCHYGNWQLVKKEWDCEYSLQDKVNSINVTLHGNHLASALEKLNEKYRAKMEEVKQELLDMESRYKKEESSKLLVIELDKYDSVPRVVYKGKEIEGRVYVSFDWKTDEGSLKYLPNFKIVHYEKDGDIPAVRTIAYEDINREANQERAKRLEQNLNTYKQWHRDMVYLRLTDIDRKLLDELMELGPKAHKEVNELKEMLQNKYSKYCPKCCDALLHLKLDNEPCKTTSICNSCGYCEVN